MYVYIYIYIYIMQSPGITYNAGVEAMHDKFLEKVASWQQVPVVFVAQHKILFPVEAEISVGLYYVPDSEMSSVHFC